MKNIRDSKKLDIVLEIWLQFFIKIFCHRGDEEEVSLEGTFASETHQRDEDTRM